MLTFLLFLLLWIGGAQGMGVEKQVPDVVIICSLLPGGKEDVGIAFSHVVAEDKAKEYVERLGHFLGGEVTDLRIRAEEGITSAHFRISNGREWEDDRGYLQAFINAFNDVRSLRIVLFPFRPLRNSLPLRFENDKVIINNLGMGNFNYEVLLKEEKPRNVSLYSLWERGRLFFYLFAGIVVVSLGTFLTLRRRKR